MDDLIVKVNEFIDVHIRLTPEQLGRFAECEVLFDALPEDFNPFGIHCENCFLRTYKILGDDLCNYPYFTNCIRKKLSEFCKGL